MLRLTRGPKESVSANRAATSNSVRGRPRASGVSSASASLASGSSFRHGPLWPTVGFHVGL